MKKVLITGGRGFIGGRLTDRLLKEGYAVRVLSRKEIKSGRENVEFVKADYHDVASLKEALRGCHFVCHLAAAIFARSYKEFAKANIEVTRNLVAACNETDGLEKFVLVSSQAAAGCAENKDCPTKESDAPMPCSDYGRTKLGAEKELGALNANIRKTVLRPPIVYGKNDSGVSKIASWVKRGIMVNTSSGEVFFSFVYVDDLVQAIVTSLSVAATNGQTYFIAEEKIYPWKYFINNMARAMGKKPPFMFTLPMPLMKLAAWIYSVLAGVFNFEPALNYDKVQEAAVKGHWICDSSKWRDLTGQQFVPLDEGLKKTFE